MIENIRDASQSWIIKVMLVFIALTFISWGGYYYFDDAQRGNDALVVNDSRVSFTEYKNVYYDIKENLREQFKNIPQADEFIKQFNVQQLAIDSLVERTVLRQAAIDNGIVVSDVEVASNIQSLPFFKQDNAFSNDLYLQVLKANNLNSEYFESQQRDKILLDKMIAFLQSVVHVTETELRDEYLLEYGKGKAKFIKVSPQSFLDTIKPTDEQIKDYFAKNQNLFMGPEKRMIEFVEFNAADYLDTVSVDQELIEDYYYDNSLKYQTNDSVHAKHILLKLPVDSSEEVDKELQKKSQQIINEINQGLSFEDAAKKYSQDMTAANGGDVGTFTRNQMVREFEDAAFTLEKGQMTQTPVKTFYGYHIIKVVDKEKGRVRPLEEVRNEIAEELKGSESMRAAKRMAKKFVLDAKGDFNATAEGLGLFVRKLTVDLTQKQEDPNLEAVAQEAFKAVTGEIVDPVEAPEGYYVAIVREIIAPQAPSINAELEGQVREQLKAQLAIEETEKLVNEIKDMVNKGESLTELAAQNKLSVFDTGLVGKREAIKEVEANDEALFKNVMFSLKKGASDLCLGSASAYVIYLQDPVVIDEKEFEKEKDAYRNKILAEKQDFIYKGWVDALKSKASITVHPSLKKDING